MGGGSTITAQLDSRSGASCYRSAALCRAGAGNACDSRNINCISGANTACAFAGGDNSYVWFCPRSVNASKVGVYRQFDPVSGIACYDSAADCAAAGSNVCGTTAQGYSGSLCVDASASFCAFSGGPYIYACPLSAAAQALGTAYVVDAASAQPCYPSQAACESSAVNTCGPLASANSGISCSNGAGATCAAAAGHTPGSTWFCPNMMGTGMGGFASGGSRGSSAMSMGAVLSLAAWSAAIHQVM